ncbi:MAG: hypothetical protein JWO67_7 [Streptosporangiaceae bacterium]|nr:hypothetical protein [Streptosporangiaceae bacterium]
MTYEPLIAPGAVWRPVSSHGGFMNEHLGLALHVTTNDFDPYGFFSDAGNGASSTWWIAADGSLEQYICARMRGWSMRAGDRSYNSVETSGQADQPMTSAQLWTLARLYAWGHEHPELQWPLKLADAPGQTGLGRHNMGAPAWGHATCPGIRASQRGAVLDRARQLLAAPTPTTDQEFHVNNDDEAKIAAIVAKVLDDRVRLLLRGDQPKPGAVEGHPDNLRTIKADTAAIRAKLGA